MSGWVLASVVGLTLATGVGSWPRCGRLGVRLGGRTIRRSEELPIAALRSRSRVAARRRSGRGEIDGDVIAALDLAVAGLRAGLPPARALAQVVLAGQAFADPGLTGLFADLARRAELGERLAPHWMAAAQARASPALRTVAIGWRLSEQHGASLVGVLEPLLSAVRADVRARAAVEAALAGPRASATLLGVLPVVGLLLGEAIGVHPIAVLLGTPVGRVALVAGSVATGVGHAWMRALVRRAEP